MEMVLIPSLFLALAWISYLYVRDSKNRYEHLEKLKILERDDAAIVLPEIDRYKRHKGLFAIGIGLGAVGPAIAFLSAAWVSRGSEMFAGVAISAWICATVFGIASTICSTLIVSRLITLGSDTTPTKREE